MMRRTALAAMFFVGTYLPAMALSPQEWANFVTGLPASPGGTGSADGISPLILPNGRVVQGPFTGQGALPDLSNLTEPAARVNLLGTPTSNDCIVGSGTDWVPGACPGGLSPSDDLAIARLGLDGATTPLDVPLRIGTLSTTPTPTPDPAIVMGRSVTPVGENNAHGITDATNFDGGGGCMTCSYNSYDARARILGLGTNSAAHYAGFQFRPILDAGNVTLTQVKNFTQGELDGQTSVDKWYAWQFVEPSNNGSGIINQYIGARFETVDPSVATEAWAIYVLSNQSYFGGNVGFGIDSPGATIDFGGARGDEVTVRDNHSVYTRTTSGNAWLFTPTTNFPATGTQQYWAVRPAFAPSAASSSAVYGANFSPTLGSGAANSNNVTGELSALRSGWTVDANYTGTVTKLFGHHIVDATAGGATITSQAGLFIDNFAVGTNRTLACVGCSSIPTGIYSIYSPSSKPVAVEGPTYLGAATTAFTIGPSAGTSQGLQLTGVGNGFAKFSMARLSADVTAPIMAFGKSRGNLTTAGAVTSGDTLMQLIAFGDDGSTNAQILVHGADVSAVVDGSVSAGIVPTKFVWTTMNAAGSLTERMELTSAGILGLGGGGAAEPALKSVGSVLQVRLLDDSAFGSLQGKLTTDTNYTAGDPTTTGFLIVYDATGTAYEIPAKLH